MTVINILKWGEAKPGHEFHYSLAWKHRRISGEILLRATKPWNMFLRPRFYSRAFRLWADAVDRIKIHGQDVRYVTPDRPVDTGESGE